MARGRGANAVLHFGFNASTYGAVPGSGYRKVPFVSVDLGETQALIESDLLGQGREPQDPTYDVVNNDGSVVVPVDLRNFGLWLKHLLGNPATTEGDDDEFIHVFQSGSLSLPDAGVEIGFPDVPSFHMNYGALANTLDITVQRSGHLNASIGLIAQGENAPTNTTGAGTPTELALKRFSQFSGEVLMDDVSAGEIVGANIKFSNGMDKAENVRPDGRIDGADPGQISVGGDVTIRFKDRDLLNKARSKTPVDLVYRWTISEFETLELRAPRIFLPVPRMPVSGPGGIQAKFDLMGAKDPGLGKSFIATLTNDVPAY